jgi:hypothetical protein
MLACEWNVLERPNNLVAGEGGVLGWLNQPASGPSWSPTDLTNAWAWYDPKDTTSLFKDASENTELVENKLVATSDNFLNTVGTSGAYASTPYESAYSITGDIDIRAKVTLPVATQGAGTFYLLTRWSTGGNSWLFRNQGNRLWFTFTSAGGTTSTNAYTTVDLLIEANVEIWYRVVRTKSDGVITFYKSTDDAETWEQIGAPRDNADGVDMYVGTSEVRVGTTTGISRNYRTHRAQIYNNALGDGTGLVYDADFSVPAKNALSFTESSDTGATVTINGAAKITNAGVSSGSFLECYGTNASGATVANNAAQNTSGDYEAIVKVNMPDIATGGNHGFICQRQGAQFKAAFYMNSVGRLQFICMNTSVQYSSVASDALTYTGGSVVWFKVTRISATGVIAFYESTDGVTWTARGGGAGAYSGDLFASTDDVNIGRLYPTNTWQLIGRIYRATVNEGIDGTATMDVDFEAETAGTTAFTESSDTGAAVTVDTDAVIADEIPNIGLMLDGTSGNCASIPDNAAFSAPSNLDMWADITAVDNDSGSTQILHGHYNNITGNRSYYLSISTGGDLSLTLGDAASGGGSAVTKVSTAKISTVFANLERCQVRGTWEGTGGLVNFYTRANSGAAWAQLGTADIASGVTGALHDAASPYAFGANGQLTQSMFTGNIYRAVMSDTIGGAAIIDADFTRQAKLATEFTESASGLTVTINQTAIAFPARIHGDRDMYQGTSSKLPTFSTVNGRTGLLFDGSNDYIKTASANLTQPVGVYYAGEVVAWSLNKRMLDGEANLAMDFYMGATTPNITIHAGAYSASTAYPVGAAAIMTAVVNGASTDFRLNKTVGSVGTNAGTVDPLGFTVGAAGGGGSNANIFMSELILTDTTADDTTAQDVVIDYMATANSISV